MKYHTEQEIVNKSNEIIDSLKDFELVEKYRIISGLHYSLEDVLKRKGYGILETRKKGEVKK
jgi:hypothetical protein